MIKIFAITLILGIGALITWLILLALADSNPKMKRFDPDTRFGRPGRQVVGGLVAFGMAGMSASFSPRDLSTGLSIVLAIAAGLIGGWWAGRRQPAP